MSDMGWLIAGGAAMTGIVTMAWGYIRSLWSQVASRVIITCEVRGLVADAVAQYLWQKFHVSPFGCRTYMGYNIFVRPTKRIQAVAMEMIGTAGKLYWTGWRPIWMARMENTDKTFLRGTNDSVILNGLKLTFIRGTFDLDRLMIAAAIEYNQTRAAGSDPNQHRYRVCHFFGTAGKSTRTGNNSLGEPSSGMYDTSHLRGNRLLQWKIDDLGTSRMNHGDAISQLALGAEAEAMVADVKRWHTSEDWYKARGIPWRRSCGLYGAPGTGKTSLVRAIGEDFDLPIFVFNLPTLFNDEFHEAWRKMLANVPCIALIEDIDAVFHHRENIAGGYLTFDCLLNCLDGVERADGVFPVVTTNQFEQLDSALTRPGRLDRLIKLANPDAAGRLKLCRRILQEWPETWDATIEAGSNDTGAQFQDRCTQIALEKYWGDSNRLKEADST